MGLERIRDIDWQALISRYRSFIAICKYRNIKLVFVTQKVNSEIYGRYMKELNDRIKKLENHEDGCYVYDFAPEAPDNILIDSVHLTREGCVFLAGKVSEYIKRNIDVDKI